MCSKQNRRFKSKRVQHDYRNLVEENVIQINGGITINVDLSVKNIIYVKKDYIWNPSTCSCENGKYLATIIEYSAIMYDELIERDDTEKKKLMK